MKAKTNSNHSSIGKHHLPQETAQAIQKRSRKILAGYILKSLIFYAVSMTILFVTESSNDLFTRETQPGWFWGVFAILVAFPIWKWKLYQLVVCRNLYGTVESYKNKRAIGNEDGEAKGVLTISGGGSGLYFIDSCTMVVRSDRGILHRYGAANEKANFIRNNYQKEDRVFYPMFAAYPFNLDREPERPFCLCCGYVGTMDETVCPECNVPFIKAAGQGTSELERPIQ